MSFTEVKAGKKKLNKDIFSLNPSAVISLFIIDFSDIAADLNINDQYHTVFYFHNNLKLTTNNILFNVTKQVEANGEEHLEVFVPAPIRTDGFEYSGRGTLPTPRLSLTVQEANLTSMTTLKQQIWTLGDLSGAKVTRIRTLAKYLHPSNFFSGDAPENNAYDKYAEFQRDVYYIDRKSAENKSYIEYELASILDLHELKLPGRLASSVRCVWTYRGPGCQYEAEYRKDLGSVETAHGYYGPNSSANQNMLPVNAPPIATANNELIYQILGFTNYAQVSEGVPFNINEFNNNAYTKGTSVFLVKNGIKYYYVCKNTTPTTIPPDTTDWIADQCAKDLVGCKFRWGTNGTADYGREDSPQNLAGYNKLYLPFGGFPAMQRVQ